ncbi:uncharacterized protein LAESUDRAFT_657988 [Laetiporus sulphureus 93-53]|uniref:Uncharacterized protein n=1 Tax=Laetiporus sulphureus 93-53 TaxID=1314785 RepID=A0A165D7S7_9APHY|nr:uncharacterized protein LAESUDRAFT_657988 [Laetiporus sulphureus 93-53]KZT04291.1 hypothetical protein LAESUDRAFT_657988 [Laetiporus sulphureus 93-53]
MLSSRPLDLNHGDGPSFKTPARGLKGKNGPQENVYGLSMTVNAKGKSLQTPRRPLTVQSHKALSNSIKPMVRIARPLGDKTPFPNRVAPAVPFESPAPKTGKLAKLSLLDADDTPAKPAISPGALLRPSSARKSLRAPRPSLVGNCFKTPITTGNHWDVSDGDVSVAEAEAEEEKVEVQEEDYDEIEYMPPTAIIPPYEPPFEMPDYSVVGKTLLEMAYCPKFDDSVDAYYAADIEIEIDSEEVWLASGFVADPSKWERLELPELGTSVVYS